MKGTSLEPNFFGSKKNRPDNSILAYYFFSTTKEGIPLLNSTDIVYYIEYGLLSALLRLVNQKGLTIQNQKISNINFRTNFSRTKNMGRLVIGYDMNYWGPILILSMDISSSIISKIISILCNNKIKKHKFKKIIFY